MDCRVVQRVEAGDHDLFIAEVEHVGVRDGTPLIFYEGRYTSLADPEGNGA